MTINYTTLLGLAQPVTGTEANTWGTVVNDSVTALVEDAIAGSATEGVTAGDWTLTTTGSGAENQARSAILIPTGTPGVSRNIIAPSSSKAYIVDNQSDGAVVLKGVATTGATIATGTTALVAWNGTDFVLVSQALANVTGVLPVAKGGTGITSFGTGVATALGQNVTGSGGMALSTSPALTTPNLGTPSVATLTNATGLPIVAGTTGTLAVNRGGTGVTTSTGTGSSVLSTSPTLVTPLLGTPTSGNATNLVGLPLTTGVTGTLPVANGGTGASNATDARTNLGLGTIATQNANAVAVTGGSVNGTTVGATTPAAGSFTTLLASGTSTLADVNSGALAVTGAISANSAAATAPFIASINGGERMRVDSAGNLLVGTTANNGRLSVSNSGSSGTIANFNGDNGLGNSDGVTVTFSGANVANPRVQLGIVGYEGFVGLRDSANSETVRLTASGNSFINGNVGIGTTDNNGRLSVSNINSSGTIANFNGDNGSGNSDGVTVTFSGANVANPRVQLGIVGYEGFVGLRDSANSETVRLTASGNSFINNGNVGIGTSSPSKRLEVTGVGLFKMPNPDVTGLIVEATTTTNASAMMFQNQTGVNKFYVGLDSSTGNRIGGGAYAGCMWHEGARSLVFGTNNIERARIDSSGNLLVGTTTPTIGQSGFIFNVNYTSAGNSGVAIQHVNGSASGSVYTSFFYNASGVGSITQNGTTAVAYNTASDYRLKNIEGSVENSGLYIDSLKPVQGTWKADGSKFIGLIAHEAQEVSQTTVATGKKDGKEMQGMDYSNSEFIANIIAELQSLRARVAQLEEK